MKFPTARIGLAVPALAALWAIAGLPAAAANYVQDGAGLFSAQTVSALDDRISSFNASTGTQIVVVTTPSLGGQTLQNAASSAFSQQNVNGVLIFIAKDDRRDIIVPDRAGAQAGWFTPDVLRDIRTSMEAQFKAENYDAGITGAVSGVLDVYRAHLGSMRGTGSGAVAQNRAPGLGGIHISMFWWIIILVIGYLVLRSVLRAMSAPRYGPGGPPGAMPPGGAPPPGGGYGYGYGPGYGGFGGGGSFWSGLLGGLGGAWLGNEMFRGGGGGFGGPVQGQDQGGALGGDAGGWQSDAGQADMGNSSGGDWSGGGFGGGDMGGGGGDSGGGW
ncbi:MAG TPA: TPM domain-containing protein [Candidatus Cybelea sp.]|jgi:uncharacterized protein|nr:TPM domain-containing protein [Candidatus Cybelea sp.]